MKINYFNNIKQTTPEAETTILEFLNNVKIGTWERLIKPINAEKDKKKRQELKGKTLPYVLISGTFERRAAAGLIKHSGFICLDIDEVENLDAEWEKVINDPYTFGAFRSASGEGIAVLVKINPGKHKESFLSLEAYYLEKYLVNLDSSCKDVSRARFVSHDPNTFINTEAETFKDIKKTAKKKKQVQLPVIINGRADLDNIIDQVKAGNIDLTRGSYEIWRDLGFAIASELGENGRDYFHTISSIGEGYDPQKCDKQYDNCVKSEGSGIRISTLFYHAKEANLTLVTEQTKNIVAAAKQGKRGGRSAEDVQIMLEKTNGIKVKDSEEVVNKVFDSNVDLKLTEELTMLEQIEIFIRSNYNLKKNEVTRHIENNNEGIDTNFINSIYFQCRRIINDKVPFETVDRLINSSFLPTYNPLQEFLELNKHVKPNGLIDALADSIDTDTGIKAGSVDLSYKYTFVKKWLVGIIASVYGEHSPLLLVLTGGQNTGKTEFFRRLLPKEFKPYYAESKLDAGKDDEILMCQKLLIMDDELGGKSKQEAKRLKELTSKDEFTLREPYGRQNVTLKRLAVLCGTSNDEMVLNDPTGNRRIIPINVLSIDHNKYNAIDKKELILEVFHLYESGYDWRLSRADVEKLNANTGAFEQIRQEAELINQFYKLPIYKNSNQNTQFVTATEIKINIETLTGQKINPWKMGVELKSLGFEQKIVKVNGKTKRLYEVVSMSQEDNAAENYHKNKEDDIVF